MPSQATPTFLYIGTARAGSSWIFEALRAHPQVSVPVAKDLHFFDKHFHRGPTWYASFFSPAKAIGEISHDYLSSKEAPARIHALLPNVRIFCCLREPSEKTVSAFLFNRTTHLGANASLFDYAMSPEMLAHNDYLQGLSRYYRLFPPERIMVLFYEELRSDPAAFIGKIYRFLEVDPGFRPPLLFRVVLPAREPRSYPLAHTAYRLGLLARKLGMANLLGHAKRSTFLESLLYRPIRRKCPIPPDMKKAYVDRFKPDYDPLSRLIGRPVPESWYRA